MLRTVAEPPGEVCSVTRRRLRSGLGLQTSRRVNVCFSAKGRVLFEQATSDICSPSVVPIEFVHSQNTKIVVQWIIYITHITELKKKMPSENDCSNFQKFHNEQVVQNGIHHTDRTLHFQTQPRRVSVPEQFEK